MASSIIAPQLLALLIVVALTMPNSITAMEQASVGELFTYKIEPLLFNWTAPVVGSEQFRYRASLANYPDLPSWLRYTYSREYHAGFLYGTPPERLANSVVRLDLVALNRKNYETRQVVLSIFIAEKFPAPNIVQMRIDNLNWVHLMDPGRVENLRNIFRHDLWPESANDLSLVFMESAVNMGGRLPLQPQQHEGVFVSLGSFAQFSPRLKDLQEEVRPLYKLLSCSYKRTSVQKLFENAGFKLDWCAFKIIGADISPEILFHNHNHDAKPFHDAAAGVGVAVGDIQKHSERWVGLTRDEVPTRNYIDEFAFAFAIPGVIFVILLAILTALLCFHHEKLHDPKSEFFFQNIFHICEECVESRESSVTNGESLDDVQYPTSTVQMVHCSATNPPVTTLKSLKDPNCLLDNASMRSQSPNSYGQTDSPSNTYLRPKPPPYKGSATLSRNSGVDI